MIKREKKTIKILNHHSQCYPWYYPLLDFDLLQRLFPLVLNDVQDHSLVVAKFLLEQLEHHIVYYLMVLLFQVLMKV